MDVKPSLGDNKCWSYEGRYVGKLVKLEHVGRSYDPDPKYTFETGDVVIGLGMKFTEVACRSGGGGGGGSIEMTSLSNATNSSSNATNSSSNATSASSAPVGLDLLTLLGAESPNVTAILEAIKNGANVDTADGKGYTPLIWAASKGLTKVVEALIVKLVDLNAQTTHSGNTALMVACFKGNIGIAELLIRRGANVLIKNDTGNTAYTSLLSKMLTLPDTSKMAEEKLTPEQRPAFYVIKQLKQQFDNLLRMIKDKESEQQRAGRRRHRNKSHKSHKSRSRSRSRRVKKSRKAKKSRRSTR